MKLVVAFIGMLLVTSLAMAADDFPLAPEVSRAVAWSYICQDWIRDAAKPPTNTPPMPTFAWAQQHCYEDLEAEILRLKAIYKDPINNYALDRLLGIYKD